MKLTVTLRKIFLIDKKVSRNFVRKKNSIGDKEEINANLERIEENFKPKIYRK